MDQMLQQHDSRSATSSSVFTFLEQRLGRISSKRKYSESADDVWGHCGLNLLSSPPEPLLDLIFVHGLRGGSRKTWSFTDNPLDFWPKEWLPRDPSFKHVRIHSFGYKSDWAERKERVLNIHDFGKALLGDIETSPELRGDGKTIMPMIFVGHSMGGLVIKKAYLLARQDPRHQDLAARFNTILFLGTPHRGADSAPVLNNILRASLLHSSKAYVSDLDPRSAMLQIINDEFRLLYRHIHLWSFYETVKTVIGGSSSLIVEKDSAIIGLPEERTRPMNANHRQICKFEKPTDSDFVTVRNALALTVDTILRDLSTIQLESHHQDMKLLSKFLGVSDGPEEDLKPEEDRVPGSCEWLIEKPSFNEWMEETQIKPKFFLLNGNPGTGKSVLTSYIVRHLQMSNKESSYFFFRHNDKVSSSISKMLLSLAYQMALSNIDIRNSLLALAKEDALRFDQMDERTLWRKVFTGLIFRTALNQLHFWVIDALDECHNYATLIPLLAKIDEKFQLRIFISTRATSDLERLFQPLTEVTTFEHMTYSQTQSDIRLFIEANIHNLPVEGHRACRELTEKILGKSNGCFLWARLVLRELEQTYSEPEIIEVLNEVPQEMDSLYTRILDGMSKSKRNIRLIKALLTWTVCARRPLDVDELKEAMRFDIGMTIPRLDKLITSICGEIVYIDKQSKVQLIHQTAREFLLGPSVDSEFAVDRGAAHAQLAITCMRYLLSDEMSSPRFRRKSTPLRIASKSCFASYASTAFSDHIARSSTSIDLPFKLLDDFLKSNVLTWIEHVATTKNLQDLMRTAKNLKSYLQRRSELRSPLGREVQRVSSWSTDLIRVAIAFGDSLLNFPFAIHFLVPPLCPSESSIYKQFATRSRSIEVVGLSAKDWDDRLSCITHRNEYCSALASRDNRFAVGLSKGVVVLYNASTCREVAHLEHGERVRVLEFATTSKLLASCSRHFLKLWNSTNGAQIWAVDLISELMTVCFHEDDAVIVAASKANHIASWRVSDAQPRMIYHWHDKSKAQTTNPPSLEYLRTPTIAQFSAELNILAIVYRSKPLILWDLEENSLIGTFDRRSASQIDSTVTRSLVPSAAAEALVFHPNPNTRLLAIAYQDGDLMLIDPIDRELKAPVVVADVSVLAASPDGRTLAAGDAAGTIKLFNFETLESLYRISCSGYAIRGLAFCSNGLRFLDIRGPQCNIWEPAVLVRKTNEGSTEDSQDGSPLGTIQTIESHDWHDKISITAIVAHHAGEIIFCARQDGSVWAYRTEDGKVVQQLYRHATHVTVVLLVWNEKKSLLASADLSSRFIVRKISAVSDKWTAGEPLIDTRSDHSINQIVFSPDGDRLLLSTTALDSLWDMTGSQIETHTPELGKQRSWTTHPDTTNHLLLFRSGTIRIFDWISLKELTLDSGIHMMVQHDSCVITGSVRTTSNLQKIVVEHVKKDRNLTTKYISVWNSNDISSGTHDVRPCFEYTQIPREISCIIGVYGSLLVFINHFGWFCSMDLDHSGDMSYNCHFFVPSNWFDTARLPICQIKANGDIIFVQEDEIAIIKDGLYFENEVELESPIVEPLTDLEL